VSSVQDSLSARRSQAGLHHHNALKAPKTGAFFIINLFVPLSHLLFTFLSLQIKQKLTFITLHLFWYFTFILLHLLLKQTHNEYR
jgi:hypothetical protein